MSFVKRVRDRKWILIVLVLFWVALFVLRRWNLQKDPVSYAFLSVVVIASFAVALLLNGMSERDFLILAAFLGLFFVAFAPFPCIIDEDYHFSRAFALSRGCLFPVTVNGKVGMHVPKGFEKFALGGRWNLFNVWEKREFWLSPVTELEFYERVRSASYLPVDYAFSAAGMWVAQILCLPLLFIVLLGRIFNYAAYAAIAYLAIRKAKHYKSLFFLVATIPCAFYGAATVGIDSSLIAGSLLFVSVTMNYCLDGGERVRTVDVVLLVLSSILILSAKYLGYVLLLPLFFFVRGKKPRNFVGVLLTLCGLTLLFSVWQILEVLRFSGSIETGAAMENVSVGGQIAWILANKGEFFQIFVKDFLQKLPMRLYACSYSEIPAFSVVSLPLRFLPFVAAARARDKYPLELGRGRRLLAYWVIASAVMMLICNLSIYLAWNPVGSQEIFGIHERYSMPYMIFVLLAFSMIQTVNRMKNRDRTVGMLAGFAVLNMVAGTFLACL